MIFHKNSPYLIPYQLTKFQWHTFFPSQDMCYYLDKKLLIRFIFDHLLKQWPPWKTRGKDGNKKIWISRKWGENTRVNPGSSTSSSGGGSSSSKSSNCWIPLCLIPVLPKVSYAPWCFNSQFTLGSSSLMFPSMLPYAPAMWNIVEMLLHDTRILTWGNNAPLCCTDNPKHVVFCSMRKGNSTFNSSDHRPERDGRRERKKEKERQNRI